MATVTVEFTVSAARPAAMSVIYRELIMTDRFSLLNIYDRQVFFIKHL